MNPQSVFFNSVFAACVALAAPSASGQAAAPKASSAAAGYGGGTGPYVSSSLPPTGHPTRFRRFGTPQFTRPSTNVRPSVSPYLNLLRGGDPGLNYHLGVVRDQAIYDTSAQTREANTQLGGIRRDVQAPPTQPISTRPTPPPGETPLKRQINEREAQAERSVDSSATPVLEEILKELKTIREHLATPPDKKQ